MEVGQKNKEIDEYKTMERDNTEKQMEEMVRGKWSEEHETGERRDALCDSIFCHLRQ